MTDLLMLSDQHPGAVPAILPYLQIAVQELAETLEYQAPVVRQGH